MLSYRFEKQGDDGLFVCVCVFIRRKGDPERAETFLQEALKSYVSEGWSLPVTHTRKQIAECQKLLGRTVEYPFKDDSLGSPTHRCIDIRATVQLP